MTVSTPADFVASVLVLQPRLAVFDCDGTLWANDAGEGFFDWELTRRLVPEEIISWARPRYADYKAGKVPEEDMCGEMVTMHQGMHEDEIEKIAAEYFADFAHNIFPEMRELVERLQQSGCEVWAVSSTNLWVIRAAMKYFGIPQERVLAACVHVNNGQITAKIVRIPSGEGKPKAIREVIGRAPDVAFGNTRWDLEMLQLATHAFAVNPTPELEAIARQNGWTVYHSSSPIIQGVEPSG